MRQQTGDQRTDHNLTFYEFFCGGGMARAGLGSFWRCVFANDQDKTKGRIYSSNWGDAELRVKGVEFLSSDELPGRADLAWASFPCQDLSLAGPGGGLAGKRSSCFWPFWELMLQLGKEGRAPRAVVLENVVAALTSHGGRDFESICAALVAGGYRFGALVVDAAQFLPQSRPRLFVVASLQCEEINPEVVTSAPMAPFHTAQVTSAQARLPADLRKQWVWWNLPSPKSVPPSLNSLLLPHDAVTWNSPEATERLVSLMNPLHRQKLEEAKKTGKLIVGAVYRRTRLEKGVRQQRAEIRFDGVAGCLRTPQGGSSRQTIVVIEGERLRSRLLAAREAARLMGLPDSYWLPEKETLGLHLAGDGVVVPVVQHLSQNLLEPLLTRKTLTTVILSTDSVSLGEV